jgi:hypothetical protein
MRTNRKCLSKWWDSRTIVFMAHTLEDGLRALREATELAAQIRVEVDDQYRRAIAFVEALSQNQSGADKTWVWRADEAFRAHNRRGRRQLLRVRPR